MYTQSYIQNLAHYTLRGGYLRYLRDANEHAIDGPRVPSTVTCLGQFAEFAAPLVTQIILRFLPPNKLQWNIPNTEVEERLYTYLLPPLLYGLSRP